MTVSDAIFVRVEDWEGLYIDGQLFDQNSMIDLPWALDGKTVSFKFRRGTDAEDQYIMDEGGFPSTYQELLDLDK